MYVVCDEIVPNVANRLDKIHTINTQAQCHRTKGTLVPVTITLPSRIVPLFPECTHANAPCDHS